MRMDCSLLLLTTAYTPPTPPLVAPPTPGVAPPGAPPRWGVTVLRGDVRDDVGAPPRCAPGGWVEPGVFWPIFTTTKSSPVIGSLYFFRRTCSWSSTSIVGGVVPGPCLRLNSIRARPYSSPQMTRSAYFERFD